jgi:hypothetical protein
MAPEGPSLSFSPERERSLIAKALFIGAKEIADHRHGQKLEAEQMTEILERRYHGEMDQLLFAEALKRALRLGFLPAGTITAEALNAFLAQHEGTSAYDLDDDIPF